MLAILLVFAVVCGCLTGCAGLPQKWEDKDGDRMVIIAGRHANATMYTEKDIQEYVTNKIADCITYRRVDGKYTATVNVSVIVSDGDPEEVTITTQGTDGSDPEELPLSFSRNNTTKLKNATKKVAQSISDFLLSEDLKADDPEVDLQRALSKASQIFQLYPGVRNHLVILDTGIVTSGFLDMNELNIQTPSPDEPLSRLPDGAYVPLDNVNVYFVGLGNVGGNQVDLSYDSTYCEQLEDFWNSYLMRCGDVNIASKLVCQKTNGVEMLHYSTGDEGDTDDSAGKGYPEVRNVPFKPSELSPEEKEEQAKSIKMIPIPSGQIGFEAGTANFKDEDAAAKCLDSYEDVLELLKENEEIQIFVVGSIANTSYEKTKTERDDAISRDRAKAVKQELVKKGISESRIIAIDAGNRKFSWRNNDEFPNGETENGDAVAMEKNRVVCIVPSNNADGMKELRQYSSLVEKYPELKES